MGYLDLLRWQNSLLFKMQKLGTYLNLMKVKEIKCGTYLLQK